MLDEAQGKQNQDPVNSGGNFELTSGDTDCTSRPERRGTRRVRRDDRTLCPDTLQVRQITIQK